MVSEVLRRMRRRISMMVARGVIKLVNDGEGVQLVQMSLLQGEIKSDMERFQNYGFTSNPPLGSEGVCVFLDGDRSRGFLIGCDNRLFRLADLLSGESAMYNDKGNKIHLKSDETCEILLNKIKVQNSTDELLNLIVLWITEQIAIADKLSTTTTNTVFGPLRLNDFQFFADKKVALQNLKTKLETFKV